MEKINFNYSLKNIPLPNKNTYRVNQKKSTQRKLYKCKQTLCSIRTRKCCRYCFIKNYFI